MPKLESLDIEYAKEFWALGNAITAFALAQSLAFVLALRSGQGHLEKRVGEQCRFVLLAVTIATIVYVCLTVGCQMASRSLFGSGLSSALSCYFWIWTGASLALIIVANAGCLYLVNMIGKQYGSQRKSVQPPI